MLLIIIANPVVVVPVAALIISSPALLRRNTSTTTGLVKRVLAERSAGPLYPVHLHEIAGFTPRRINEANSDLPRGILPPR